ncbi:MAG: hypothetical protein A3F31_01465 [Candidatus Levybacteria bacterium RIFCSPHIGHO2_12_FULL_38_12]|nr:MAG: hypothetical protein A3D75_02255 [Candidatus Levybacteria bacterium RIFCSPHIGHO2_02_FULL_37_18]OGH22349.1 MAG: hypothetical protein A3F31_01465 [Candidatus Levybacteria bacterium RIFCSPHIGHO2_12_FULL_38_12]OGH34993.1 MAG: hypothetical protein A3A47_03110 [Candidatus Levybacteria bacterium RIFCSPLOWO2_01_FULL_37_20]OGH43872.1 MAG: hypothetical protein A3J14_02085 [Candidatus Levybacteria bacterium RIFCSPLOWO2_02_FULL_37_18]OGH51061.1 MAG: hypothetical protein A3G13_03005 [Candidatus Levy
MKFVKNSDSTFIIRLVRGEEILDSIERFCQNQNIKNAVFWGIGSIEDVILAHYRVDGKKFSEKKCEGIFEITSLIGNVSLFEQKPLVHPHISISNEQMEVFGGHLMTGKVSATVELVLQNLGSSYAKKMDEEIGLKLWDLPQSLI